MKTKNLLLLAALTTGTTLGSLALAPSAEAIAVNWVLNNVTFQDGAIANGSFTYDGDFTDGNGYSNINITVSNAPLFPTANSFTFITSDLEVGASSNGILSLARLGTFGNTFTDPSVVLDFVGTLSNSGGTISLALFPSGLSAYDTAATGIPPFANGGSVQGTPVPLESDALPIVGAAAFMAGGMWWKHRRAQAKANLDFLGVELEKSA